MICLRIFRSDTRCESREGEGARESFSNHTASAPQDVLLLYALALASELAPEPIVTLPRLEEKSTHIAVSRNVLETIEMSTLDIKPLSTLP